MDHGHGERDAAEHGTIVRTGLSRTQRLVRAGAILGAALVIGAATAGLAPQLGGHSAAVSGSPSPSSTARPPRDRAPGPSLPPALPDDPLAVPVLPPALPDDPLAEPTSSPNPMPAAPSSLSALQFVSPQRGWAVGGHFILATTDGGTRWVVQRSEGDDLRDLDFVDTVHGWAVGAGTLLATVDGGATWAARNEPADGPVQSVHFVSPSVGWGVVSASNNAAAPVPRAGSVLVRTSDGGRSWQPQPAPFPPTSVCFADLEHGWLSSGSSIYRSADGGRHWDRANLPAFGDSASIQCAGTSALWVLYVGGSASGRTSYTALHTADGVSWVPLLYEPYMAIDRPPTIGAGRALPGPGSAPGPFSAIGSDAAAFVAQTSAAPQPVGVAIVTRGGAAVSRSISVPDLQSAGAVSFISPTTGWLAGQSDKGTAVIYATKDGGRSWLLQYSGYTMPSFPTPEQFNANPAAYPKLYLQGPPAR